MLQRDVRLVNSTKPSLLTPHFVFKYVRTPNGPLRVAFAFARKSGTAVRRNRYKRRIRELVRHCLSGTQGIDIFCIARGVLAKITLEGWHAEVFKIRKWCERIELAHNAAAQVL